MRRRPRTKVLLAGWHLPDRGESGFYNGYVQKPAGGPLAGLSDRSPMAESPAAPRLTAALDEGLARRLTLVCAPAGFGKTALLAHRELEILLLLAAGKSNQRIARELVVTLDTVKKHVSHLLGKLGAANRTEAVTRARDLGVIP